MSLEGLNTEPEDTGEYGWSPRDLHPVPSFSAVPVPSPSHSRRDESRPPGSHHTEAWAHGAICGRMGSLPNKRETWPGLDETPIQDLTWEASVG